MSHTRNVLSKKDNIKLADFMRARYVESGLTDGDFAALASKELNAEVNRNHVLGLRNALDIANNNPRPPAKLQPESSEAQIAALRERIEKIESGFEYRIRLLEQR